MKKILTVLSIACLATTLASCNSTSLPDKEIINMGQTDESKIIDLNKDCIQNWVAPGAKTIADLEGHFSDTFSRKVLTEDGTVTKDLTLSPSLINQKSGQYIKIQLPKDPENVRTILTKIEEKDFQVDNVLKTEVYKSNFNYLSIDNSTTQYISTQILYTLFDESYKDLGDISKNQEVLDSITKHPDGTEKENWEYNQYLMRKYTEGINQFGDIDTLYGSELQPAWSFTAEASLDNYGDCIRKSDVMSKGKFTKETYLSVTYLPMLVSCYERVDSVDYLQKMTIVFGVLDYSIVYKNNVDDYENGLEPDVFYNITYDTDGNVIFNNNEYAEITNQMYQAGKIYTAKFDEKGNLK